MIRVSARVPFTRTAGPRPQRVVNGVPPGTLSGRTPGTATSPICTGTGAEPNRSVSRSVVIGWKRSLPAPSSSPSRTSPCAPVTVSRSAVPVPDGRRTVSSPIRRALPHEIVRCGSRSSPAAVQVVAGSPSNAERGSPAGCRVQVELAVTRTGERPRVTRSASAGSVSTAEPVIRATAPDGDEKRRSKPSPSSSPRPSSGEQTQRAEPFMHSGRGGTDRAITCAGTAPSGPAPSGPAADAGGAAGMAR